MPIASLLTGDVPKLPRIIHFHTLTASSGRPHLITTLMIHIPHFQWLFVLQWNKQIGWCTVERTDRVFYSETERLVFSSGKDRLSVLQENGRTVYNDEGMDTYVPSLRKGVIFIHGSRCSWYSMVLLSSRQWICRFRIICGAWTKRGLRFPGRRGNNFYPSVTIERSF